MTAPAAAAPTGVPVGQRIFIRGGRHCQWKIRTRKIRDYKVEDQDPNLLHVEEHWELDKTLTAPLWGRGLMPSHSCAELSCTMRPIWTQGSLQYYNSSSRSTCAFFHNLAETY